VFLPFFKTPKNLDVGFITVSYLLFRTRFSRLPGRPIFVKTNLLLNAKVVDACPSLLLFFACRTPFLTSQIFFWRPSPACFYHAELWPFDFLIFSHPRFFPSSVFGEPLELNLHSFPPSRISPPFLRPDCADLRGKIKKILVGQTASPSRSPPSGIPPRLFLIRLLLLVATLVRPFYEVFFFRMVNLFYWRNFPPNLFFNRMRHSFVPFPNAGTLFA